MSDVLESEMICRVRGQRLSIRDIHSRGIDRRRDPAVSTQATCQRLEMGLGDQAGERCEVASRQQRGNGKRSMGSLRIHAFKADSASS